MKKSLTTLVGLALALGVLTTLLLAAPTPANAVTLSSGTVLHEGDVNYTDVSPVTLPGTIISKTFQNLDPITLWVTYTDSEFDFQLNGFRWSERILNNTGVAWADYHVQLTSTSGKFFGPVALGNGDISPGQASINLLATPNPTVDILSPTNGTVVNQTSTSIDFIFGTPILAGGFLDIHIPMENLPGGQSVYSFTLTQQPSPVPEPATVLLLGSGLVGLSGAAWRRRRRKSSSPA